MIVYLLDRVALLGLVIGALAKHAILPGFVSGHRTRLLIYWEKKKRKKEEKHEPPEKN